MPKLTNIKTGQEYHVTDAELEKMAKKPNILKAFRVVRTTVPDEVLALRQKTKAAETKTA